MSTVETKYNTSWKRTMARSTIGFCACLCALPILNTPPGFALSNNGLDETQAVIERRYEGLPHMTTEELAGLPTDTVVLFDARGVGEYETSHIANAIQVPPKISPEKFTEMYAAHAGGKTVVFYCSVGHRSSKLASRVKDELLARGATNVVNLKGGIFEWHNEGRPLVNAQGPTYEVHPYNRRWGKLIDEK